MDTKLTSKLTRMATQFSTQFDTPDDAIQAAHLAVLERAAAHPDFYNQTESYQIHAGRFAMWAMVRKGQKISSREVTASTLELAMAAGGAECEDDYMDTLAGDSQDPEAAMIAAEEAVEIAQALADLSGQESKVLEMVVAGLGTGEIAQALGVSAPAVSCYKKRIVAKVSVRLSR